MISLKTKIIEYSIVFLALSIIYCIYTYPLVLSFGHAFLGDDDAHIYIFNSFSYANTLNPMFTDWILYPKGDSLWMHTHTLAMSVFANLFENDLFGINLFILLNFALSGLGAYLIAKKFLENNIYSFICAFIFTFSSYKIIRLSCHTNLVLTAFVPFFIYFFLNLSEESNRFSQLNKIRFFNLFGFMFSFSLSFFCDYVVTICGMYFLFSFALYFPLAKIYRKYNPKTWKVFIGITLLFILFDLIIQVLRRQGFDHKGGLWYGGDIVSFFVPFNNRFLSNSKLLDWYHLIINDKANSVEGVMYAGYSLILLGVFAFVVRKSVTFSDSMKGVIFSSVLLAFISLPQFRVFGKRLFFSPTAIQHFIPMVNEMRCPIRVFYVLIFLVAIIIFYTLIHSKWKDRIVNNWIAALILILLFFDYLPTKYPIQNQEEVPKVYYELAKKPKESLLVYPFGIFDGYKSLGKFDKIQLSNIRIHRKKVFGGHLSRLSENQFDFIRNNYFLNTLCAIEEGKEVSYDIQKAITAANKLPLDYIIIPKKYLNSKGSLFLEEVFDARIQERQIISKDILLTLD